MSGTTLPTNIDATYADSGTDASVQLHQQYHDTIHGRLNTLTATVFDVRDYGAVADVVPNNDGAMTSGSATLTSTSAAFTSADVGKKIIVSMGSGHTPLATSISAFTDATHVTLAATATQTVTGAIYFYGTDDTTAVQAAITDAQAVKGVVQLHPTGRSLITSALSVTADIAIIGLHSQPIHQSAAILDTLDLPTLPPYYAGSGLVVAAVNTNGITITGTGLSINLRDFAIIFGGVFNATGDGINYIPGALSTGYNTGLMNSEWRNLSVFGHDGSHYAYKIANSLYCTFVGVKGYGGGGLYFEQNSAPSINGHYGNFVCINPYFCNMVFSTTQTHGFYLKVTASTLNLMTFIRPQASVVDHSATFPAAGTNTGTTTALPFKEEGCQRLVLIGDDFEGLTSPSFSGGDQSGTVSLTRLGSFNVSDGTHPILRPYASTQMMGDLTIQKPVGYATMAARPDPRTYGVGGGWIIDTGLTAGGLPVPLWADNVGDWRKADGSAAFIPGTAGGAGTTPASVAGGPLNWWDASSLGVAHGASVSSVSSTGSGANALTCTSVTAAKAVVNGKDALRFDGVSANGSSSFTLNQPVTFFLVMRMLVVAAAGGRDIVLIGPGGSAEFDVSSTYSQLYAGAGGGTACRYNAAVALRTWGIVTGIINAGSSLIRLNGTQLVAASASIGTANPAGIRLGHNSGRAPVMDIAEAVIYNTALTNANMLAVEQWLGTKYAIATA